MNRKLRSELLTEVEAAKARIGELKAMETLSYPEQEQLRKLELAVSVYEVSDWRQEYKVKNDEVNRKLMANELHKIEAVVATLLDSPPTDSLEALGIVVKFDVAMKNLRELI